MIVQKALANSLASQMFVRRFARLSAALLLTGLLAVPASLWSATGRTQLKPGWTLFGPERDIELGREAAGEAEKQLPLLHDRAVNDYLTQLGKRLARYAPGHQYPYQFKAVNQAGINAFALPGGFIYMNRGTMEEAKNEAQLAGVLAHEIAHVALRHGANQLSKAVLAQMPLAIFGGWLGGGGGIAAALGQMGIATGANLLFAKFSRDAERQADILGAQMLYDAGYDPREMARFFETLAAQSKTRTIEFFASHPNPENREARIEQEINNLGGVRKDARKDSEEFHIIQTRLREMPPPPKPGERRRPADDRRERPESRERAPLPSRRMTSYRHTEFSLRYPSNWEVVEESGQLTFAPPQGVYRTAQGNAVGYGLLLGFQPLDDRRLSLESATDALVRQFQQSNPGLQERSRNQTRVAGRRAYAIQLEGESPLPDERETDWLFVLEHNDKLLYLIFVVPQSEERAYRNTFQDILDSLRLR